MTYQDPMYFQPREGKLPIWAQDTIRHLRLKVEQAEAAAAAAALGTKPEESSVIIEKHDRAAIGLGHETITFKLGEHWTRNVQARVENGPEGKRVVIQGGTGITVRPRAANSVEIFADRR